MENFMSQNQNQKKLKFVFLSGDRHRNGNRYREDILEFLDPMRKAARHHGVCPECLREHFPDECTAIITAEKTMVTEKIMHGNRVLFGCFFIVTNRGYLYGGHNKEQRF